MTMLCRLMMIVLLFLMIGVQSTFAESSPSTPAPNNLPAMLKTVLPAVVNVRAKIKVTDLATLQALQKQQQDDAKNNSDSGNNDDDQSIPTTAESMGSGVIVDARNGYIITNAHVVADAQSINVSLGDGRHYAAKMIGIDKPSDVALLQIKATNLTAVPLGDSNQLLVGDFVAAIGNPFGLNQTVTSGIVSALGRTTLGIENYENFIQTDAPINPGNSGGALINREGELVGINTAILAPERGSIGIGFAIPINMAKSVMQQLLEYGNVKRGVLGVGAQDITPELATAFHLPNTNGAAVAFVLPDSPAAQAGIEVGDIITGVDDTSVKNASEVVNTIGFLRVNSKIELHLLRNNKPITATIKLTDPQKREALVEAQDPFLYGVGLKNFSVLSPLHGNVKGIMVLSVAEDSNAWHADIRAGDVITSVNQQKVENIEQLKAEVAKANQTILLNVLRGPTALFLVISKEP